jgi:hypothetical protein
VIAKYRIDAERCRQWLKQAGDVFDGHVPPTQNMRDDVVAG